MSRLQRAAARLSVRWDEARGVVASARGEPLGGAQAAADVEGFLAEYGALFAPVGPGQRLRLLRSAVDPAGWTHLEYQQEHPIGDGKRRKRSYEVYGSKVLVHVDASGRLVEVRSNCWRDIGALPQPPIDAAAVRRLLTRGIPGRSGGRAGRVRPLTEPRLVVYPWQGRFRVAWTAYTYVPDIGAHERDRFGVSRALEPGDVFVDAFTGEIFLVFPSGMSVAGTGRGVTPIGGPFVVRALGVEQAGAPGRHVLRDTSRARDIVTYDDGCRNRVPETPPSPLDALAGAIAGGVLPLAENLTGPHWARVAADATDAEREASQQPAADAHFFCAAAYDWYDRIAGGRVGWDAGAFPATVVEPNHPVRVISHAANPMTGSCRSGWAQFWRANVGGLWRAFLLFCDGDVGGGSTPRPIDFPSGSQSLVGHEYQHAVTYFSFRDGSDNPGLGYTGWGAALHEGLSDAFGGMFAQTWGVGREVSHDTPPVPIRNLAYPRDPDSWENRPGGLGHDNKDHFADQAMPLVGSSRAYDHGTILGHAAFLMDAGGVHQRVGRLPELIPVYALGVETINGAAVSRAARIWYRALASYSATFGQITGSPADVEIFPGLADACRSAAAQLYGVGSREHCTTALALRAVGLGAAGVAYGADPTFLRWAWDWRESRPYLGGIHGLCPTWASLDLFINNGDGSGWTAVVNVLDSGGNATNVENRVYCRIRNVGDQPATDITVTFLYAKAGTAIVNWLPVLDSAGTAQVLHIPLLAAGQLSFPDADQETPPAAASVVWAIPPLTPGETVGHYCLRAIIQCADDVNPFNNDVQSNVAHLAYTPGTASDVDFSVGNPAPDGQEFRLQVTPRVPKAWVVTLDGPGEGWLPPGEERTVRLRLDVAADEGRLHPPLDGELEVEVRGMLAGRGHGTLTAVRTEGGQITGRCALDVEGLGVLLGTLTGRLDVGDGTIAGRVTGRFATGAGRRPADVVVMVQGILRPWRVIDIHQMLDGTTVGGITVLLTPQRLHDDSARGRPRPSDQAAARAAAASARAKSASVNS